MSEDVLILAERQRSKHGCSSGERAGSGIRRDEELGRGGVCGLICEMRG